MSDDAIKTGSHENGGGKAHPWRTAAAALAGDRDGMSAKAFCEIAAALGWGGADCDIGVESWASGLEFGDNTGEALRSIEELPLSQGRRDERLVCGTHPVRRMLDEAWSRSSGNPRLRAVCAQVWEWGRKDSEARLALRGFCEASGAAAASWLAGRTIPVGLRAFLLERGVGVQGLPTEIETQLADECSENFENRIWDAEPDPAEARRAWSEALLGELARFDGEGSGARRWAAVAAGFSSALRARLERFDNLEDSSLERWRGSVGLENALKIAGLRAEARGPRKGPAEGFAALVESFVCGAGAGMGQGLKDRLVLEAGFGGSLPDGWGSPAGAAIGARASGEVLSGCWKTLEALAVRSAPGDLAGLVAGIAGGFAERFPHGDFKPLLSALGESLGMVDWRAAVGAMPRAAACELALRASPSAEAGLRASVSVSGSMESARDALGIGLPEHVAEALVEAWAAGIARLAPEDLAVEVSVWDGLAGWKPDGGEALDGDGGGAAGLADGKASSEPGAEIWTSEEWGFFKSDVESVENRDAFGAARDLIKKVSEKKLGPRRTLAVSGDLFRRLDVLAGRFPHFGDMVGRIGEYCRLSEVGDGALGFPPLLMVGGAGIGKTYFSSMLAELAGTRLEVVDLGGTTAGWVLTGLSDSWSSGKPGRVFRSLAYGDRANPVFLLDELDKADGDPRYSISGSLLPLLEPHSAKNFADECVPLRLDASRICWLATANDAGRMSAPLLSRFDVFTLPNPNERERRAMCSGIYGAVLDRFSWGSAMSVALPEETLDKLASLAAEGAARDLRRSVTSGCARAVAAGRREVLPGDLPEPVSAARDPWDAPLPEVGR